MTIAAQLASLPPARYHQRLSLASLDIATPGDPHVSRSIIAAHFDASLAALQEASGDGALIATLEAIAAHLAGVLAQGGKILIAGNGGSAADAQHIAAELVGRYKAERRGLPAIALTTDTSALTAIGNDYGFGVIFARQVQALGRAEDALLAISTSGRSANILAAIDEAKTIGMTTIGFCGGDGGTMAGHCDLTLIAPGPDTATIQQIHMVCAHAICDAIEKGLDQL